MTDNLPTNEQVETLVKSLRDFAYSVIAEWGTGTNQTWQQAMHNTLEWQAADMLQTLYDAATKETKS